MNKPIFKYNCPPNAFAKRGSNANDGRTTAFGKRPDFAQVFSGVEKMAQATLNAMYAELKCLHKDVEELKYKYFMIPVEKVSKKELAEIRRINREMEAGKRTPFEEVFNKKRS